MTEPWLQLYHQNDLSASPKEEMRILSLIQEEDSKYFPLGPDHAEVLFSLPLLIFSSLKKSFVPFSPCGGPAHSFEEHGL